MVVRKKLASEKKLIDANAITKNIEKSKKISIAKIVNVRYMMSDNDIKWIDLCESLNKKFKIIVSDDDVCVVDTATNEEVYKFSECGMRFTLALLRYIGCNAEEA